MLPTAVAVAHSGQTLGPWSPLHLAAGSLSFSPASPGSPALAPTLRLSVLVLSLTFFFRFHIQGAQCGVGLVLLSTVPSRSLLNSTVGGGGGGSPAGDQACLWPLHGTSTTRTPIPVTPSSTWVQSRGNPCEGRPSPEQLPDLENRCRTHGSSETKIPSHSHCPLRRWRVCAVSR